MSEKPRKIHFSQTSLLIKDFDKQIIGMMEEKMLSTILGQIESKKKEYELSIGNLVDLCVQIKKKPWLEDTTNFETE